MKPTDHEAAAARRLAEALLGFLIALERGRAERRAAAPKDTVVVRVDQPPAPPPPPREPPRPDQAAPVRQLLTVKEAAECLGIGTRTLWRLTAPNGPIPVVRIGRRVCYPRTDLEEYVRRARVKPHRS